MSAGYSAVIRRRMPLFVKYNIGIDIGGTKMRGVLVKGGRVVSRADFLNIKKSREEILEAVSNIVRGFRAEAPKNSSFVLGLGVPSPLDPARTTLLDPPNLPLIKGLKLAGILERKLGMPVRMENDARCFLLGADPGGKFRKYKYAGLTIGLTLGTGLGGAIMYRGNLWSGEHGAAGEVGHTVVDMNGENCVCGRKGCLEAYASKMALLRWGRSEPKELESEASKGNTSALKAFECFGKYLGRGISNIINCMDPGMIILGGGIAHAQKYFLTSALKTAKEGVISPRSKKTPIIVAKNMDDAGAIGAAGLFQN